MRNNNSWRIFEIRLCDDREDADRTIGPFQLAVGPTTLLLELEEEVAAFTIRVTVAEERLVVDTFLRKERTVRYGNPGLRIMRLPLQMITQRFASHLSHPLVEAVVGSELVEGVFDLQGVPGPLLGTPHQPHICREKDY